MPQTKEDIELKPDVDPDEISSKDQAEEAVEKLWAALRYHNYRYYVEDDPVVADVEYDRMMNQLQNLEENYPGLQKADSPTRQVGGTPNDEVGLVDHDEPMLSLKSATDEEEIRNFDKTCRDELGEDTVEYICEPKYDGLAIELVYEDGKLTVAGTRGDGQTVEDITDNIKTIKEVPLRLLRRGNRDIPEKLVVRGEVYMRKDEFKELNERRSEEGENPFANPRNAAAASLISPDV